MGFSKARDSNLYDEEKGEGRPRRRYTTVAVATRSSRAGRECPYGVLTVLSSGRLGGAGADRGHAATPGAAAPAAGSAGGAIVDTGMRAGVPTVVIAEAGTAVVPRQHSPQAGSASAPSQS